MRRRDNQKQAYKSSQTRIRINILAYTLLSTSFLVCSSDKHYSTSQHQCGLDLSMTRQFFEKLSRKEKVLKEVAFKFILFAQFTTI